MRSMRRVVIVGPPPVQVLDVTGPLEVFSNAPGYVVQLGNPGSETSLQTNRRISLAGATPIDEIKGPIDTLMITGGPGAETGIYDERFVAWITEASARSRRVASICTGTFLLGAAGLIDGKKVVTHWKFCDDLARRFPAASVQPDPIYLKDGAIYTSAGITAGIDLSLALVEEDYRPALASPTEPSIRVLGEELIAGAKLAIHMMLRGEYISEYDAHVARKLANVLAGGPLTESQLVSEQYLLDLERETFVSLCGERKTQERIAHTLKTGKPLRN